MRRVALLGATGSIGRQTVEIVERNPELELCALAASTNGDALADIARDHGVEHGLALVEVFEEGPGVDEIERALPQRLRGGVALADLAVPGQFAVETRVHVEGEHRALGPDALAEPPGDGAGARAEFQATPARGDADALEEMQWW